MNLRGALSRLPVRLVALFVALALVDVAFQIAPSLVMPRDHGPARAAVQILGALVLAAAMIVAYRFLIRYSEQRGAEELAARHALGSVLLGTLGGVGLFLVVFLILLASGVAALHGVGSPAGLPAALAIGIGAAVGEEIVFRGVLFRLLEQGLGTSLALALSAAAFGLLHAFNPGATVVSTLAIAAESGVLMGVAYSASRTLWVPIGLHFGWNFTEGGIFGAAVSGGQYTGLLGTSFSGPRILTGGEFGPEASILAVLVSVIASLGVAWIAQRRGRWRERSRAA